MYKMAGQKSLQKLIFAVILLFSFSIFGIKKFYVFKGTIESIRKDNIIVIISQENIDDKKFSIIENNKNVADFIVLNTSENGKYLKIIAKITLKDAKYDIIVGQKIGFISTNVSADISYPDYIIKKEIIFKNNIKSKIDNREMVLIDRGSVELGANNSEDDEYPKHIEFIDDFYIDKYEVSNSDYLNFVKSTNTSIPKSWNSLNYANKNPDLPVLVSYEEAKKYAKWAGKKLPSESQWQKAACGNSKYIVVKLDDGYNKLLTMTKFPWGNKLQNTYSNCIEYWESLKSEPRLLSIYMFKKKNVSAFGAVNMTGNASEWTSSWYTNFENNTVDNKYYNKKLKVIKGGAFYNSITKQYNSKRYYGGIPNLYEDNIAGFRCIKKPDSSDLQ